MVNKELKELYFNEHTAEWKKIRLSQLKKYMGRGRAQSGLFVSGEAGKNRMAGKGNEF